MRHPLLLPLTVASREKPDAAAFTWLEDGERAELSWSWRELHAQVSGAAQALSGLPAGARVFLSVPQGPYAVTGMLGAMAAGLVPVPIALPLGRRASDAVDKVLQTVAVLKPAAILTTKAHKALFLDLLGAECPELLALDAWGASDLPLAHQDVPEQGLAWLQLTSGSTRTPRAVRVTHRSLQANIDAFDDGIGHRGSDTAVNWLPYSHDLGMVYGLCIHLHVTAHVVWMDPEAFVRKPIRWMRAMSDFKAAYTATPDFGIAVSAFRTTRAERAGLDLRACRAVINAAEPIRKRNYDAFVEAFGPLGFSPEAMCHAYGMSESTARITRGDFGVKPVFLDFDLDALGRGRAQRAGAQTSRRVTLAGVGRACLPSTVLVVDPESLVTCGPGQVGEVWAGGPSVCDGYEEAPEASAQSFGWHTAEGTGPCLRTGDYGFLDDTGELFITGRIKDVIIVRGVNHAAETLEWRIERAHPAIRAARVVAVAWDGPSGEQPAVALETAEDPAIAQDVLQAVRGALSDMGLQAAKIALVRPRGLPITSSGKRRRLQTRADWLAGKLDVWFEQCAPEANWEAAPTASHELLDWLRAEVGRLLGLAPADVPEDAALRDLGMDSLDLQSLAQRIEQRTGKPFATTALFDLPSLKDIGASLGTDDGLDDLDEDALVAILKAEMAD